ncbi:MFS transporter [Microbacterium horticulturae]|uniref:MFS transporter n=1 Tax=Microbacterium horticulturae TaxID=3028316 RepID=A0ABY8BWH3_9MICO|nr:MFS transporter [Microbacterium sp. KACC 23027]WEG08511.1 MFS transporter [Microbacterium sp. KACC 23027]
MSGSAGTAGSRREYQRQGPELGEPIPEASRQVMARLDRIRTWSLSPAFLIIIGLGFLFTFYDIFDINVSFVQTCTQLVPGCTPETALNYLALPTIMNLLGYVVGTLVLSPLSDRIGRRNMLLITMLITGLGSLYTALAPDYANFVVSRAITGIGIGADLAIVNTYVGEVAPKQSRAKFTTVVFIMSAVGAFVGIWLGLILTTEATPWPTGLPFAAGLENGWRWMYVVGAALAIIAILLRFQLPESVRWLLQRGRTEDAAAIADDMERRALRRGALAEPSLAEVPTHWPPAPRVPYSDIFGNPIYLRRVILLFFMWFVGYITVYAYAAGLTSVLTSLTFTPPEAGIIAAVGSIGFIIEAVVMSFIVEKLERRYWLPIGTVVTFIGAIVVAVGSSSLAVTFIGAMIIFAGFNLWVSPSYAMTIESFPTRARSTGFAIVDGVGHVGGGIGILILAPLIPHLSVFWSLMLISSFLIIASILAQFTPHTRNRVFEEVSP